MTSVAAKIFGVVLLLLGACGFVPGFFYEHTAYNVVHIASGVVGIWAGFYGADAARLYLRAFGAAYGFATLLGFMDKAVGLTVLHASLAGVALLFGFRRTSSSQQRMESSRGFAWLLFVGVLVLVATATLVAEGFGRAFVRTSTTSGSTCDQAGRRIEVRVTNDGFQPAEIAAKVCDTIVFQNKSNDYIEIALGNHNHHLKYPGLTQGVTASGEEKILVLSQKGTYLVHDHLNDSHQAHLKIQ